MRGPNVCAPPGGDATDSDANGVDSINGEDATLATGACVGDDDCLATETCADGQCLVTDSVQCEGKADGTSCANYIVAVTCKGGSPDCGGSWTVAKYGGAATCQGGACKQQAVAQGRMVQSTCSKYSVCVPSKVGGVQPCQKRERVPACATTP